MNEFLIGLSLVIGTASMLISVALILYAQHMVHIYNKNESRRADQLKMIHDRINHLSK